MTFVNPLPYLRSPTKLGHSHQACDALAEDSICGRAYGGKFATPYIKGTKPIVLYKELNIEGTCDFFLGKTLEY
jgi:hypothetical protein